MKKFLKWFGILIGVLVLVAGGLAVWIATSGLPKYDVKKIDLKAEATPERVARGQKLSSMLCQGCHMDLKTGKYTGQLMPDLPTEFGVAYSRNITQHPTKGIGGWTDGEIAWLLRTGIHPKTGSYVPPWMVKLPHMADEDILSIIAFLRSADPRVQAADVDNRESQPSFLAKALSRFAFKPFDYPSKPIPLPDTTNKVELGRYYANGVLDCYTCHSADFKTMDQTNPEKSEGYYGGGNMMGDLTGRIIPTANITPDKTNGIGNWTEDQFVQALKGGMRPDSTVIRYPMARYTELTDDEARAIYAFLKTVPALATPRKQADSVAGLANASKGKKAYYTYGCAGCHGATGTAIGDLTSSDKKYPTDSAMVAWLKHPDQIKPGTKMPAWDGIIKEADYPDLCAYIRDLCRQPAGATDTK